MKVSAEALKQFSSLDLNQCVKGRWFKAQRSFVFKTQAGYTLASFDLFQRALHQFLQIFKVNYFAKCLKEKSIKILSNKDLRAELKNISPITTPPLSNKKVSDQEIVAICFSEKIAPGNRLTIDQLAAEAKPLLEKIKAAKQQPVQFSQIDHPHIERVLRYLVLKEAVLGCVLKKDDLLSSYHIVLKDNSQSINLKKGDIFVKKENILKAHETVQSFLGKIQKPTESDDVKFLKTLRISLFSQSIRNEKATLVFQLEEAPKLLYDLIQNKAVDSWKFDEEKKHLYVNVYPIQGADSSPQTLRWINLKFLKNFEKVQKALVPAYEENLKIAAEGLSNYDISKYDISKVDAVLEMIGQKVTINIDDFHEMEPQVLEITLKFLVIIGAIHSFKEKPEGYEVFFEEADCKLPRDQFFHTKTRLVKASEFVQKWEEDQAFDDIQDTNFFKEFKLQEAGYKPSQIFDLLDESEVFYKQKRSVFDYLVSEKKIFAYSLDENSRFHIQLTAETPKSESQKLLRWVDADSLKSANEYQEKIHKFANDRWTSAWEEEFTKNAWEMISKRVVSQSFRIYADFDVAQQKLLDRLVEQKLIHSWALGLDKPVLPADGEAAVSSVDISQLEAPLEAPSQEGAEPKAYAVFRLFEADPLVNESDKDLVWTNLEVLEKRKELIELGNKEVERLGVIFKEVDEYEHLNIKTIEAAIRAQVGSQPKIVIECKHGWSFDEKKMDQLIDKKAMYGWAKSVKENHVLIALYPDSKNLDKTLPWVTADSLKALHEFNETFEPLIPNIDSIGFREIQGKLQKQIKTQSNLLFKCYVPYHQENLDTMILNGFIHAWYPEEDSSNVFISRCEAPELLTKPGLRTKKIIEEADKKAAIGKETGEKFHEIFLSIPKKPSSFKLLELKAHVQAQAAETEKKEVFRFDAGAKDQKRMLDALVLNQGIHAWAFKDYGIFVSLYPEASFEEGFTIRGLDKIKEEEADFSKKISKKYQENYNDLTEDLKVSIDNLVTQLNNRERLGKVSYSSYQEPKEALEFLKDQGLIHSYNKNYIYVTKSDEDYPFSED